MVCSVNRSNHVDRSNHVRRTDRTKPCQADRQTPGDVYQSRTFVSWELARSRLYLGRRGQSSQLIDRGRHCQVHPRQCKGHPNYLEPLSPQTTLMTSQVDCLKCKVFRVGTRNFRKSIHLNVIITTFEASWLQVSCHRACHLHRVVATYQKRDQS